MIYAPLFVTLTGRQRALSKSHTSSAILAQLAEMRGDSVRFAANIARHQVALLRARGVRNTFLIQIKLMGWPYVQHTHPPCTLPHRFSSSKARFCLIAVSAPSAASVSRNGRDTSPDTKCRLLGYSLVAVHADLEESCTEGV